MILIVLPGPPNNGQVGLGLVEFRDPDGCLDGEPPAPGNQGQELVRVASQEMTCGGFFPIFLTSKPSINSTG